MSQQEVINWLFGFATTALGWYLKTIWETVKDLQKADITIIDRIQGIEVLVAGKYPTREEFESKITAMFSKLDRIEDKLDGKVDKS